MSFGDMRQLVQEVVKGEMVNYQVNTPTSTHIYIQTQNTLAIRFQLDELATSSASNISVQLLDQEMLTLLHR